MEDQNPIGPGFARGERRKAPASLALACIPGSLPCDATLCDEWQAPPCRLWLDTACKKAYDAPHHAPYRADLAYCRSTLIS